MSSATLGDERATYPELCPGPAGWHVADAPFGQTVPVQSAFDSQYPGFVFEH